MSDFDALVSELLKSRPELTRDELTRRIEEKKKTVGAGYLTDQGALFLVAGELGINLQHSVSSDLSLKDLHIGANDITVVARVLAVYPVSIFQRKDGGEGRYRKMMLFDKERLVKLTVWDDKVDELDGLKISVDTPVRVLNGYVKQGLDGKPNLNLGKRGKLELLKDDAPVRKLGDLDDVTEKLTKTTEERFFHAVDCVVSSEPRYSEFVRSDGSQGSLFQFEVTGQGGKDVHRVVIWSPSNRPELRVGESVRVTNLRAKRSSHGEFELHGDAGSMILSGPKPAATELRIAAISGGPINFILSAIGKDKKVRVVDAVFDRQVERGDVVSVSPDRVSGGKMICQSQGSLMLANDSSFPSLAELTVKVKDAKDKNAQIMVEVIALSNGAVEEVRLRDGQVVKKGELVVGDDSGEVQVVGWRDQSEKLSGIQPGERLRVVGAIPRTTKMGALTLQISESTVIDRLKGRV